VAALGIGAVAFWFGSRRGEVPPDLPVAAVAAPPVVTSAGSPPPAASGKPEITLRIETTPAGARVLLGGKDEGATPVSLPVEKSDEPVQITLTRPGYVPRKESVVPNVSQRLVLPLTPARTEKPKSPDIPRFR
jgi:hypothetical protein